MRGDAERGAEVLNIAVQNKRQFTTPANEHVYGDSQPKGHEKCCAFPKNAALHCDCHDENYTPF